MAHFRFPAMKSGLNPSAKTMLNMSNLTPTQKVEFTRNRIWGNIIGGNERSGFSFVSKPLKAERMSVYYELSNLKMVYPFIDNWAAYNKKKLKYEDRKKRIFMRGVKIGNKKGANTDKGMSLFAQGRSDPRSTEEFFQMHTEEIVKDNVKDDDDFLNL